jgi:hypothetical protein
MSVWLGVHCRYTDGRQKSSSSERQTFSATPTIHLLSFYFDSMSCSHLVKTITGYGLHSQGLVLSRSREFLLCQQTDCPWSPSWTWIWCTRFYHCGQYMLSLLGTLTTSTFILMSQDLLFHLEVVEYNKNVLILCFVCSQLVGRKWVHHGQQTMSNVMSKWSAVWCTETQ